MGTSLTGLTPATTYDALIKVGDNGPLSATAKVLSDGLGNDSPLAMSTTLVGIGTATPLTKLQVAVDVAYSPSQSGQLYVGGTNTGKRLMLGYDTTSNYAFIEGVNFGVAYSPIILNPTQGNVGIGTSSPNYSLQVNSATTTTRLQITNSTTGAGAAQGLQIIQDGNNTTFSQKPNGFISFETNNVERARFTANGLTFNGDTAAANALDDYEEGTWTPVITDGTNDATMIAGNGGVYTKIGRQVTATAYCRTTSLGSVSGDVFVKGLPFASLNNLQAVSTATFGYYIGMNLASGQSVGGYVNTNATQISLTLNDLASGTSPLQASEWSATGYVHLSITYFV
jgi:hypothetical protein